MDLISSRYRKPKGRPTKRRKMLAENSKKRWQKSSKTVDEKNSNSMVLQRDTLSEPSTSSQPEASYIFTHKAVFSELLQKVPCKYCTNCTLVIKQQHIPWGILQRWNFYANHVMKAMEVFFQVSKKRPKIHMI
ncbi:uncharacterized protein TNCV_4121021 [Trichonephila clavipes]|nr:uncharacterized protein TNCV_4121021 [Trichonephila clavipes]